MGKQIAFPIWIPQTSHRGTRLTIDSYEKYKNGGQNRRDNAKKTVSDLLKFGILSISQEETFGMARKEKIEKGWLF